MNNFFMWWVYLYLEFQIGSEFVKLVKSPIEFLCFSSLLIINNYNNLNYSQSFVNVFCQKKISSKWQSVKPPVANKCNCNQYELMFITWSQ